MSDPDGPFDYGIAPNWHLRSSDLCGTSGKDYPQPRRCGYDGATCHLGHPANCDWWARERATPEWGRR